MRIVVLCLSICGMIGSVLLWTTIEVSSKRMELKVVYTARAIAALQDVIAAQKKYADDYECSGGFYAATVGQLTAVPYLKGNAFMALPRTPGYRISIIPGEVVERSKSCTSYALRSLVRSFMVEAVPLPGYDLQTLAVDQAGNFVVGEPEK